MRLVNQLLSRIAFLATLAIAMAGPAGATWCGNPLPPCDPSNPNSKCYQPPPPDPRCEPRECGKCTKSPCYVGSGVYVNSAVDLELPTPGFPLSAARYYESTHTIDGPMGHGWTSSLTAHLYYATYLLAAPNVVQREANITMPDGARYRFTENSNGTFTAPLGRYDSLVRNPDESFDLTLQRTTSKLHFASDGALMSRTDDYGNLMAHSYDSAGHLERIADQAGSGRFIDVYWGADGRISDLVDSAARQVTFTYDAAGLLRTTTDPLARETHYSYLPGRYVPLLASISDNWGRTLSTVSFDSKDRVTGYMELGVTYTYVYGYQNAPSKTAKLDSEGNTWIFTQAGAGLVTNEVAPGNSGTRSATYYADGSVQQQVDELGIKTHFTYDGSGRIITRTADYQGPSALTYRFTYHPDFPNHVISLTPENPTTGQPNLGWQAWRYDYYPLGAAAPGALHHSSRVLADGSTSEYVDTYEYDSRGRVVALTDAGGNRTDFVYKPTGDIDRVIGPANNDGGDRPETIYQTDAAGQIVAVSDLLGTKMLLDLDLLGRVTRATAPAPSANSALDFTTTYTYDDYDVASDLLLSHETDPNGSTVITGRDPWGRVVLQRDPLGGETFYQFHLGQLASTRDPHGYVTNYFYDARHRLIQRTFPDGSSETQTYWPDGELKTATNRSGTTTSYSYDRLKRVAGKLQGASNLQAVFSGQQLTAVTFSNGIGSEAHEYGYDLRYRLAYESQGSRGTVRYQYGQTDRLMSIATDGGPTAEYSHYPDGSVDTITWSELPGSFKYFYDLGGNTTQILFPNGQQRLFEYDQQRRKTRIENRHPASGNMAAFTLTYDETHAGASAPQLGRLTTATATVPSLQLSSAKSRYFYDSRAQLTRVEHDPSSPMGEDWTSWTYDLLGNRLTETSPSVQTSYNYQKIGGNPANWTRLLSEGTRSYEYDVNGSLLHRFDPTGDQHFSWSDRGELRSISGTSLASFEYDFLGRRVIVDAGTESTFLYSGSSALARTGDTNLEFLLGPGVDQVLAIKSGGQIQFLSVDALGSVISANTLDGTVVHATLYDPWGQINLSNGASAHGLGFTGRESADGLSWYYRTRWYDSRIGRFTQEDKLADFLPLSGRDLYSYVDNSPTQFVDPFGLLPCTAKLHGGPMSYGAPRISEGEWSQTYKHTCHPGQTGGFCPKFVPWGFYPLSGYELCGWQRMLTITRKWRMKLCFDMNCVCPAETYTDCEWVLGDEVTTKTDFDHTESTWIVANYTPCSRPFH